MFYKVSDFFVKNVPIREILHEKMLIFILKRGFWGIMGDYISKFDLVGANSGTNDNKTRSKI